MNPSHMFYPQGKRKGIYLLYCNLFVSIPVSQTIGQLCWLVGNIPGLYPKRKVLGIPLLYYSCKKGRSYFICTRTHKGRSTKVSLSLAPDLKVTRLLLPLTQTKGLVSLSFLHKQAYSVSHLLRSFVKSIQGLSFSHS